MNLDLEREWRRWLEADAEGGLDEREADVAFRTVFGAVPRYDPRPGFTDRVVHAVRAAAVRRSRRARAAAIAGLAASALVSVGLLVAVLAYGPELMLRAVDLAVQATLWIVAAVERGLDVWAILAQFGRAAAAVVSAPQATLALVAIGLVSVVALYGLQRILAAEDADLTDFGFEQESSR